MREPTLDYLEFVNLVLDALRAAGVEYLIGGAVAAWAWGEPRSTPRFRPGGRYPRQSIGKLSHELEIRDMLVPIDIILDVLIEERG